MQELEALAEQLRAKNMMLPELAMKAALHAATHPRNAPPLHEMHRTYSTFLADEMQRGPHWGCGPISPQWGCGLQKSLLFL